MTSFWKRLFGGSEKDVERDSTESPEERQYYAEGVEGRAADSVAEERLGGFNPASFVDDEFKP